MVAGDIPHNRAAEESVLGALLMHGDWVDVASTLGLAPSEFFVLRHQTVAEAIFACADSGTLDVVTVTEHLRRLGQLEQVGGAEAIQQLALDTAWSFAMLPGHVEIIVDNARRRQLITDFADATAAAYNGEPVEQILTSLSVAVSKVEVMIPSGFVTLDRIESKAIRWAWQDRIPVGEVTLLGGAEKVGKSLVCIETCARASRGQLHGDWHGQPVDSLYLTAEDRIAQVVKPRMVLAGANVHRIHVQPPEGGTRVTIARIAAAIRKGVRLVVLDPLVLFLEGLDDENTDLKVRDALDPVIGLAQLHDASIVGIKHTNKSEGRAIMNRIAGSRGYTAAVRSVLFVVDDPDSADENNPDRLIFARGNLGPGSTGTRYRIIAEPVDLDDGTTQAHPHVVWMGESSRSINEAFAFTDRGRGSGEDLTDAALIELLATGPVEAVEAADFIKNMAGVSERTARRHLSRLGGGSRKVGSPTSGERQKWEWFLPASEHEGDRESPKGTSPESVPFDARVSPSTETAPSGDAVNLFLEHFPDAEIDPS